LPGGFLLAGHFFISADIRSAADSQKPICYEFDRLSSREMGEL
jgi:hypothetical protein